MSERPGEPKVKEWIDTLLSRANEEAVMRRHHETLRDRAGATFLTLSTALLALIGAVIGRPGPMAGIVGLLVPAAVLVLGVFGTLVGARNSDHVLRHMAMEDAFRVQASAEFARASGLDLDAIRSGPEAAHGRGRGALLALLAASPTRWLWMVPNAAVAVLGLVLSLAALRSG